MITLARKLCSAKQSGTARIQFDQDVNNKLCFRPGVVKALTNLFDIKSTDRRNEDLRNAYPEPQGVQFLNPESLGDVEAYLRASGLFAALKADNFLVKIAENLALLARPLVDGLSYVAEVSNDINPKILAERLADASKALISTVRLTETARIELVCAAFKVPVSAAKTERDVFLMGHAFAKDVERLRKHKKVLMGKMSPQRTHLNEEVPSAIGSKTALRLEEHPGKTVVINPTGTHKVPPGTR